ncbi:uncharacterized protein LOC118420142 [Branchiostoma floridae]|nr:uncharacterized protein LOC118420142 [Branchiostoma floridae]
MSNVNVKNTCLATGMRYPCVWSGSGSCTRYWTSDCITLNTNGVGCNNLRAISKTLCGSTDAHLCQRLDDVFVYFPKHRRNHSAWGVDYNTSRYLWGSEYKDMYALCAGCRNHLGMESGAIPDWNITASSEWKRGRASDGRLNGVNGYGAWVAAINIVGQWLQVGRKEMRKEIMNE